jgi:hypothetical protein
MSQKTCNISLVQQALSCDWESSMFSVKMFCLIYN